MTRHPRRRGGQVRIVGGSHRGRRVRVPGSGVRPSPDRARETLFNWLADVLPGARCLDLFAGSGVLGFEALSRGAARAVLVERHPGTYRGLRRQAAELELPAECVHADAMEWLRGNPAEPFDVVFLDPPYRSALVEPALEQLVAGGWLAPHFRVYIECDAEDPVEGRPLPRGLHPLREARVGRSMLRLLKSDEDE